MGSKGIGKEQTCQILVKLFELRPFFGIYLSESYTLLSSDSIVCCLFMTVLELILI